MMITLGTQAAKNKPITITIWTNLTVQSQTEVLKKQLDEIITNMPNVEYRLDTVPFSDMYVRLITALQQKDGLPNLMHTTEGPPAFLHKKGVIVPVDDVLDKIGRDDFVGSYLRSVTKNGKTWGVPDWALHQGVWYRKDLFKEKGLQIPKSWEELIQVSEALNADTNNDGKLDVYGFAVPMHRVQVAAQTYFQFLYSAGVYVFDPKTGEYAFGDNKKKAEEALEAMINLYKAASNPSSIEWSWGDYRNAIVEGNVAQTNEWGAIVLKAKQQNPDILKNLSVYPFPGPNKNEPAKASLGGGYYFIVGKSSDDKVEISKNILEALYTPEMVAERALSRPIFAIPATKSGYKIYKNNDFVKQFKTEVDTIFSEIMPSWYRYGMEAGLNPLAGQIEATTFIGDAIQSVALEKWTVKEAVDYIDENLRFQISLLSD